MKSLRSKYIIFEKSVYTYEALRFIILSLYNFHPLANNIGNR